MSRDVEKSEDAVIDIPIDPLIDEAASVSEAKQGKNWTIDFDALKRLLRHECSGDSECPPFQDTEPHNAYGCTRKDSRGETPQKIILYSESSESTIHTVSFNELGKFAHNLASIFSPEARVPWWLHVQNPTVNELRLLCSAFRVHPLTVEDILGQEIREKIEDYTTYYFACVWSFQEDRSSKPNFNPYTIYLVVFPSGTLSFCFSDSHHVLHVRERIDLLRDHYTINSDWIFYAFVDDIVDSFLPQITLAEKRVTEIEDQVYTARLDDIQAFIREIEENRKTVSSLIRLLSGKNNVLSRFDKHHCVDPSHEDVNTGHSLKFYIGDIQDHLVSMLANLRQFESLLARSQETCIAGFEIGVLSRRKRINALIAVLTLMTMIMSLMNIVCSVFSTNVNASVPLYQNNSPAWFIIVGLEVLVGSFLFWLARRFRWW